MKKATGRVLLVCAGLAALLFVASLVAMLSFGRTPPPPLPNPNGYDDLTKAGQIVIGNLDDLANLDRDSLRVLVATNAEVLRLLRVGLSRDCSVPTDAFIANFGAASRDLVGLKRLSRLLNAEGRLAELENRPADAARSYLDAIRLGAKMSRGGLIINRLVGIACEGGGSISLVKLLPTLSCDQLRPLAGQLAEIDEQSVTWPEVLRNENRFTRAQMGNYPNPIKLASDLWNGRKITKKSKERHDSAAAHLRLLAVELALRCHRCDHGKPPTNLTQLSPNYLPQMPNDPFSGQSLIYKATGTNWTLYSVGPDRIDDGGKPAGKKLLDYSVGLDVPKPGDGERNKGDIFYDSPC